MFPLYGFIEVVDYILNIKIYIPLIKTVIPVADYLGLILSHTTSINECMCAFVPVWHTAVQGPNRNWYGYLSRCEVFTCVLTSGIHRTELQ